MRLMIGLLVKSPFYGLDGIANFEFRADFREIGTLPANFCWVCGWPWKCPLSSRPFDVAAALPQQTGAGRSHGDQLVPRSHGGGAEKAAEALADIDVVVEVLDARSPAANGQPMINAMRRGGSARR